LLARALLYDGTDANESAGSKNKSIRSSKMKSVSKVLFGFAMLLSASSSYAQVVPSRGAVIQAAGHLTVVTDNMSIFAQNNNYPNTADDLAEIMNGAMRVEEAARFSYTPAEAMFAYNDIVRTWFSVRQRLNTICRFYSQRDCYFIRNNVRMAINALAASLGQPRGAYACAGSDCQRGRNADDEVMNEIPVPANASWGNGGSGHSQDPTPAPTGGWNP
jgi:hypothetical protein